ncbi:unnamed protein product [Phytomonas sp. Hart1]|nr:unnamed protein product [Phytomonas sp. Hart1]|eukprot:CCW69800.1 unnamed protein product [Phytomonas sp. isolate Hart1]
MPLTGVNKGFLHRCCIQLSSPLMDDAAVEAGVVYTLSFVELHAGAHAAELARALVWRIVDTDDDADGGCRDRTGAWRVLDAVLQECGDPKRELCRTVLAEKLALFLPYLIAHRWYSAVVPRDGEPATSGRLLADAVGFRKVVSAEVLTGTERRVSDAQRVHALTRRYRGIMAAWRGLWRADVYESLRHIVRSVERGGNYLSAQGATYLEIPNGFRDSLWRLRRHTPRPGIARLMLFAYGWDAHAKEATTGKDESDENDAGSSGSMRIPDNPSAIAAMDAAMHPTVRHWLRRLISAKGGCRGCDTWRHLEERCPCEIPFTKTPTLHGDSGGERLPRRSGMFTATAAESSLQALSYMEAVDKLYRHGIALPLRMTTVLDRTTQLIMEERPYDDLLTAFDRVRGAITGPRERHALWLHAGYQLMPSKTVFSKPSDDQYSPALEKAEHFFKTNRRFREWDQLLRSVETLDTMFRRRVLPPRIQHNLNEIKETSSFFFCLIDGSLPEIFTPGLYARVPEEVIEVAPLKDSICEICLEPFHCTETCTSTVKEPWDLQVARLVLEEYDLDFIRFPSEFQRVGEAIARIDQDDRQAKEFRKKELMLAVKLIHEHRVPICKECGACVGHRSSACTTLAKRVLADENIQLLDMCLNPEIVQRRLHQYQMEHKEKEWRRLHEAYQLLGAGSKAYPSSYWIAIKELDDAQIPLAAARYSTDAVQGFLLYINSGDLLARLAPLRDELFPDVCLFCDSYHHSSAVCGRAEEAERGFIEELQRAGLNLWQYFHRTDYYDERLPTDYPQGKVSVLSLVRQFSEDYGPGGVARARFMEYNGLEEISQVGAAGTYTQSLIRGSGNGVVGSSPYGCSFSQLVEPVRKQGIPEAASPTSTTASLSHFDLAESLHNIQPLNAFMDEVLLGDKVGGGEENHKRPRNGTMDLNEDDRDDTEPPRLRFSSENAENTHFQMASSPAAILMGD